MKVHVLLFGIGMGCILGCGSELHPEKHSARIDGLSFLESAKVNTNGAKILFAHVERDYAEVLAKYRKGTLNVPITQAGASLVTNELETVRWMFRAISSEVPVRDFTSTFQNVWADGTNEFRATIAITDSHQFMILTKTAIH